jgi:predicted metal-dependent enzyme (double-stranded beta helix superfamily)
MQPRFDDVLLGERLDPAELTAIAEAFACTSDGWRHQLRFDQKQWFSTLLHADERVDVWLCTWLPGQSTDLHERAGSAMSVAVVDGRLDEQRLTRLGRLHRHRHRPGRPIWLAPGTVHKIGNRTRSAAVSVHAYSPPLLRSTAPAGSPTLVASAG